MHSQPNQVILNEESATERTTNKTEKTKMALKKVDATSVTAQNAVETESNTTTGNIVTFTAPFNSLVPSPIVDLLHKLDASGSFPATYKGGISFSNPILQQERFKESVDYVKAVMSALGTTPEQVGYIADISKKDNNFKVYTPSIKGGENGNAVIYWGKARIDLADLKAKGVNITFDVDKYVNACLEFIHENIEYIIEVPLRTPKGSTLTRLQARSLFAKGELGYSLVCKSANVTALEPGLYNIVASKQVVGYQGAVKHDIQIENDRRWFSAPNKLESKLAESNASELPTSDAPWTIKLGEIKTSTFSEGRTITYREVLRISSLQMKNINLDTFILEHETQLEPATSGENQNAVLDELAAGFELE